LVTTITFEMVQANVAEPLAVDVSVAVTTAVEEPVVVGVPETIPVEASMDRPEGRPMADQVRVWPTAESLAVNWTGVMATPGADTNGPGLVTVTLLVTVQLI